MRTYSGYSRPAQEPAVMMLTEDMIVSPLDEGKVFLDRFPKMTSKRAAIRAIVDEWMTGCYDEHTAAYWITTLKLTEPRRGVDAYQMMVILAKAEYGDVQLPRKDAA